jgi:hypothetical protein
MAMAAALLLSHAARAMEDGGGSSGGMGTGLPLMGHGGIARVLGAETLDVEGCGVEFEDDIVFWNEHINKMQVCFSLKHGFLL